MNKILLVDDSKTIRMLIKRNLRQAGFDQAEILEAEDGAQGLAVAKAENPDLILSDWNMPEMSGMEFLQALRADGIQTTFGFITSETTPTYKEQALAAGASFLLSKPFNADSFAEALGVVA
ncbi:response regulator [Actinomarinicola tropica]|uniref:Response regulator n=1 Tax=Actinomarinicola tropica TaxID=2789776 RepID=A0A5Q2RIC4_9ACTN|nr:response regulator [Actinomarinicola tropica]QGG94632.1 response regulator [Actinomarinicola tropica]